MPPPASEMIANYVGDVLFTKSDADVDTLIKQMTEGLTVKESNAVTGFVRDFIAWVKSKVEKLGLTWDDVHLQRLFAESFVAATSNVGVKENTTNGGVEYYQSNTYDSGTASVKEQIKNSQDTLNKMSVVFIANVPASFDNRLQSKKWAVDELKKYGFKVDRQSFGTIEFSEKNIYDALDHLDSDTERASIAAIYHVLKRGIQIGEHGNHKNREKHTVTFGAPVELNGVRGNMAVVVNMKNHKYYIHRVLLPDGSSFKFDAKENTTQEAQRGVPKRSLANATRVVSNHIVPQNTDLSRGNFEISENTDEQRSIPEVEGRYSIPDEAKANADKAAKHFGTTSRINEAGYILVDGRMLDMSGKHDGAPGGYRTVDHRDIKEALGLDYGGEDYSGAMVQFMSEGNIRIAPESGGINVSVMPNQFQRGALTRFINKFGGEVVLDIDDLRGNTVASVEYPYGTSASVVLNDVSDYFEKGKLPESFDAQYSIPLEKDTTKTSYSIPRLDKRGGVVYKNYISYSKIGAENINAIRIKLREIYKGIDDAIADNVPVEVGDTVFVVDSGKDNGKITFGVRRRKTIKNEVARKDFIRSTIDDGLSEVSYSKELFEVFERELGKYSGRGMRREVGAELSDNQRQSENIEGEILRDDTDRGRSGLNRVKSDDGRQYSIPLTKDTDGKKLSPEQAEYFKYSKERKKIPNEDRSGSCF